MHRTSLKEKVCQYLFLFPKVKGDTQTDSYYSRNTLLGVYRTMALRRQSSQQDFIDYNHKSVARRIGNRRSGIGDSPEEMLRVDAQANSHRVRGSGILQRRRYADRYWAEKNHQLPITNYPLLITHYPLPITNCLKHCPWQEARRGNY
ncbi:MAG: hypothetical protein KME28_21105 [Pelatocladus maniniholoensis HA4357-MV3]|jgi:hypothetical protein|uniref:Uncharacterized protein n=1 Tax=Pelatocladus maniniholoensis HA4357-MV3 TaxID=1117104 RepID=A0A9E3LUS7_9NOST|nr:hypothetical protein [Pelatocladus maniniholoensis HA4357-MV3]BAZ66129.1 hypothetical protein NIES4106_08760 [Fischerella sp. NIES-4106]